MAPYRVVNGQVDTSRSDRRKSQSHSRSRSAGHAHHSRSRSRHDRSSKRPEESPTKPRQHSRGGSAESPKHAGRRSMGIDHTDGPGASDPLIEGSKNVRDGRKKRRSERASAGAGVNSKHRIHKSGGGAIRKKGSAGLSEKANGGSGRKSSSGIGKKRRPLFTCGRKFWIVLAGVVILLVLAIGIGVGVSKNKTSKATNSKDGLGLGGNGEASDLANIDPSSIPAAAKNTELDPFSWSNTTDFNVTYTDKKVGGLSVMGLFDKWDDSTRANDKVPPLNEKFPYGKLPIRGVNLGGWLLVEPFITPSFFEQYDSRFGVIDEFTLSKQLGPKQAKQSLEDHYESYVTEATFKEIRDAGLDHVRIPFGYWAVKNMEGDAFVEKVAWRYLLRGIEWARKYGLRVKLDLHSVPGGANGWNHSGRQGVINWLNGPNGEANGKKTLELHQQLATFFSQPRYKNIVTMYGLVNEPKMITLDAQKVIAWSEDAYDVIRSAGYEGVIVFGDGFRGLNKWRGAFQGKKGMLLDVHEYVIFNSAQIQLTHTKKVEFVCKAWTADISASMNPADGFGPTMVGEWGQADTDCTKYLNNVGVGTRWEGDFRVQETGEAILTPSCPKKDKSCSCEEANADPSRYTREYKQFLRMFAEAQMDAFERGWGWMYWTWDTENAHQWSYKKGMAAGILPKKAWERDFKCTDPIPDFAALGLPETY